MRDAFGVERSGISKRKEKPEMSDDKLAHRKKLSAATTIVSSTLGIAGLAGLAGAKGLPRAAGKLVKHPKVMAKAPKKTRVFINDAKRVRAAEKKGTNIAWGLSTGAGGVGGIGGYNYASIQRAEAKKKKFR